MSRDDEFPDQPYTDDDLKKPGFDPFEAHLAWLERRRSRTPEQLMERFEAAMQRVDEALEKLKHEQLKPKKRKKVVTEEQRSVKLWKAALADVKQKKKKGLDGK